MATDLVHPRRILSLPTLLLLLTTFLLAPLLTTADPNPNCLGSIKCPKKSYYLSKYIDAMTTAFNGPDGPLRMYPNKAHIACGYISHSFPLVYKDYFCAFFQDSDLEDTYLTLGLALQHVNILGDKLNRNCPLCGSSALNRSAERTDKGDPKGIFTVNYVTDGKCRGDCVWVGDLDPYYRGKGKRDMEGWEGVELEGGREGEGVGDGDVQELKLRERSSGIGREMEEEVAEEE